MKKHLTSFVAVAGILTASADISNPGPTGTVAPEKKYPWESSVAARLLGKTPGPLAPTLGFAICSLDTAHLRVSGADALHCSLQFLLPLLLIIITRTEAVLDLNELIT